MVKQEKYYKTLTFICENFQGSIRLTLQTIQGELANNTLKLIEINKSIKYRKKSKEVEGYPNYSEEQKQLNTEKQARLEIQSHTIFSRKNLYLIS